MVARARARARLSESLFPAPRWLQFELADNVELGIIVREFESYYEFKLGRRPKMLRRRDGGLDENAPPPAPTRRRRPNGTTTSGGASAASTAPAPAPSSTKGGSVSSGGGQTGYTAPDGMSSAALGAMKNRLGLSELPAGGAEMPRPVWLANGQAAADEPSEGAGIGVSGTKVAVHSRKDAVPHSDGTGDWGNPEERLLKPLPAWDFETRALAEVISRDIYQVRANPPSPPPLEPRFTPSLACLLVVPIVPYSRARACGGMTS